MLCLNYETQWKILGSIIMCCFEMVEVCQNYKLTSLTMLVQVKPYVAYDMSFEMSTIYYQMSNGSVDLD